MTLEVLLATMYQSDFSIIDRCNIKSDCVVINQCDKESEEVWIANGYTYRMYNSQERGISRSRNLAIGKSTADVCVLADDDIIYRDGYRSSILEAFSSIEDADIIVFNINSLDRDIRPQEQLFTKVSVVPWFKTYSSVHIAFRRESILRADISFDSRFGTGSGVFTMGEDSLFMRACHRAGLHIYKFPAVIADLHSDSSTWFTGYNESYFEDVGAYLSAAYPFMKFLMKYYYPIRFRKLAELGSMEILASIDRGFRRYEHYYQKSSVRE